jgi:hypothetical protein
MRRGNLPISGQGAVGIFAAVVVVTMLPLAYAELLREEMDRRRLPYNPIAWRSEA